ncbi:MAG TPA: hypothetical protein VMT46_05315 [Anaerolineaceae bacterium]|nr:hypothetical protein [Anaerolineaceae bacterium]
MNDTTQQPKDPNLEEARMHMREARRAVQRSFEALLPAGTVENQRKARKEFLLALRSMINAAIDRVERPED